MVVHSVAFLGGRKAIVVFHGRNSKHIPILQGRVQGREITRMHAALLSLSSSRPVPSESAPPSARLHAGPATVQRANKRAARPTRGAFHFPALHLQRTLSPSRNTSNPTHKASGRLCRPASRDEPLLARRGLLSQPGRCARPHACRLGGLLPPIRRRKRAKRPPDGGYALRRPLMDAGTAGATGRWRGRGAEGEGPARGCAGRFNYGGCGRVGAARRGPSRCDSFFPLHRATIARSRGVSWPWLLVPSQARLLYLFRTVEF